MADILSRTERSERMALIRSGDTRPEWRVRRLLHDLGYRYRLHVKELPGRPDIVFTRRRKIVLVHGCFWHQHDQGRCRYARRPKSNTGYWHEKLARNVERDIQAERQLIAQGWEVLTVWECESRLIGPLQWRLVSFLGPPRFCAPGETSRSGNLFPHERGRTPIVI